MITKFTKTILITTIILLGSFFNTNAKTSKAIATQNNEITNIADGNDSYCGVSEQEIVNYLAAFGYHVVKTESITGCCNALCKTIDNKRIVVYVTEGQIIGHDEIII